ncbi:hypothetical protein GCM10020331_100450 [Ectobacillus funiculus]
MNGPVRRKKIDSTAKLEKEDRSISFMSGQKKAEQTVCLAVGFASIHLAADVNEQKRRQGDSPAFDKHNKGKE